MLRFLSPGFVPALLAVAAYLASPLIAAQMLQRAILAGDVAQIERSVEWHELKVSLRSSIKRRLFEAAAGRPLQRSFLQRISYSLQDKLAPGMIDRMIERQATPEGFISYFKAPRPQVAWTSKAPALLGGPAMAGTSVMLAAPRPQMLARIQNPHFVGPARFVFEVADRKDPERIYRVEFRLGTSFWKLAHVEVVKLGSASLKLR